MNQKLNNWFAHSAQKVARWSGNAYTFLIAIILVIVWAVTGPFFHYSNSWQLVINTGTSIATFLMVFLIQNTQNHDAKGMQLKLNELIRALEGPHAALLNIEELSEEELETFSRKYGEIARYARRRLHDDNEGLDIAEIIMDNHKP